MRGSMQAEGEDKKNNTADKLVIKTNKNKGDIKMKTSRINEIKNRITAFENEKYTRDEILTELLKLQSEMANIAFGDDYAEGKRFYDIFDHYSYKNNTHSRASEELMRDFRRECGAATNCIRAEISGRKGENRTFYKLNYLLSAHELRKNIEIHCGDNKTEIDVLVVTEKAAFIIEVKNSKRDIFIDADGQYYRTGEFLKWDSDIGFKLALREEFVRSAAREAGISDIKVERIVVFTDNRISVQNKCKSIKTCFLNQLTSLIDCYKGEKQMSLNDIANLVKVVDGLTEVDSYKPDIDIQRFKNDFAQMVATIDYPEDNESAMKKVWWKNWRTLVSSMTTKRKAA